MYVCRAGQVIIANSATRWGIRSVIAAQGDCGVDEDVAKTPTGIAFFDV